MQLGSLLTIANAQPANFMHIVFNNGVYDTSGAQPTLARDAMSFADMAKSAGYSDTYTFSDIETFDSAIDELMEADGPILIELITSPIGKGERPWRSRALWAPALMSSDWPAIHAGCRKTSLASTIQARRISTGSWRP